MRRIHAKNQQHAKDVAIVIFSLSIIAFVTAITIISDSTHAGLQGFAEIGALVSAAVLIYSLSLVNNAFKSHYYYPKYEVGTVLVHNPIISGTNQRLFFLSTPKDLVTKHVVVEIGEDHLVLEQVNSKEKLHVPFKDQEHLFPETAFN